MRGEGVFIKLTALGTIFVCIRRNGDEEIFSYHLPTLLRFMDSYFRMERKR